MAVDSGYLPDEVFKYTRKRKARGVFAIAAPRQSGKPILLRRARWISSATAWCRNTAPSSGRCGTDTAKHSLFALAAQRQVHAWIPRSGCCVSTAELEDEFFRQFCAEVWDPHKRKWVKVHTRNEGLDITVYAIAAGYHPKLYGGVHKIKDQVWEKLEEMLEPKEGSLFAPRR
jgi:phage terminase large subunit GpA-like protein